MEMSNKLKFLLITTCALLHLIGTSSGFYLKEHEDSLENTLTTDNSIIADDSFELERTTIFNGFFEDNETTVHFEPAVTTDHSVVINKIIENVQNITTLRSGKSLENNITVDLPENNDEIIKDQLKELNGLPTTETSAETNSETIKPAVEELLVDSTVNDKKTEKEINSTNNEENSINLDQGNIDIRKTEKIIESRPEKHVEIQKITTGEEIEESIKKAVRDEIRSETPLDQNTLDVLESIPDEELRESVAKDILGDDYLQHAEFKENLNGRNNNVKYETIASDSLKSELSGTKEQEEKSEDSLVSSNKNENTETTEYVSDSVTTTSEENDEQATTESSNENSNSLEVESKNVHSAREGRAMDLNNSIRQMGNSFVDDEEKLTEVNNDQATTILPDVILTENKESEMITEKVETTERNTDTPSLENESENIVEGRNAVGLAEIDEPEVSGEDTNILNSENVTEHVLVDDMERVNKTSASLEENHQITSQEGELKDEYSEDVVDKHNLGQDEVVVTEVSVEDMKNVVENQNFPVSSGVLAELDVTTIEPEQKEEKQPENNVGYIEKLNDDEIEVTTILPEIETTTVLPMNVEIKESLNHNSDTSASDSSESKSSEEASEKEETAKIKNKNEKSDSSESTSSEEDDDEKKEKIKINLKPKGRSFSVDSQPKVNNISNDLSTSAFESEVASEDSEHMVMKKASAESEDENLITSTSTRSTTIETNKKIPIVLNPRLKILLPHDETERIPKLTFETTTLLPMKIFKSHPLEPVRTDDIPNETNFQPRLLDDIPQQPEQQKQPEEQSEQQKSQEQIQELLKTESTTRLIGETMTEGVELSKDVNRNMNLFLDPFETNRTSTNKNLENNSIASDEIMAASSIAEALPNQHLKRSDGSLNTTLVILICASIVVMIIAVLIVTFFRFRTPQGVLDIELQEQRHGKQRNSIDDHDDDDDDNDLSRQNINYHCCKKMIRKGGGGGGSNVTNSSTDGGSIGIGECNCFDSSSHLASCSLITTATVSSKSSISLVKRSISNSSRSNTSIKSELASAKCKMNTNNDETTKLILNQQQQQPVDNDNHDNNDDDNKQIKQIPTETCKLIPKIEISEQNNSEDSPDNNDGNNIDNL